MREQEIDRSRCPLCGGENDCTAAKGEGHSVCWCMSAKIPRGLLERIPQEMRGRACVCRRCVEDYLRETGEEA